ncbi:hypothetical protein MLD38_019095 [Melastoma candidum]|uniref:Uncharacterized protein n=1 Tax=Melastoma candidum TaxID=119954 RepID=A0ACB9QVT6_9MYRT|nr:hypothetical protein MLD38_019095 [Melastoma candidum]
MDSPPAVEPPPPPETNPKGNPIPSLLVGLFFLAVLFPFALFFSSLLFIGLSSALSTVSSHLTPASPPYLCRIVSSSVDIRYSKVCELGLLNYNAKTVFSPSEKRKFRCHYDYYWASVFKVEYEDALLGQMRVAFAEVPNEALPVTCRPGFRGAWLTKDSLKINETYECWSTSRVSIVNIYHGNSFSCQAKEPSTVDMIQRYYILFRMILESLITDKSRSRFLQWEAVAGLITGFFTSIVSIRLIRLLNSWRSICSFRMLSSVAWVNWLKRACLFIAYVSFTLWLAVQYGKRIGLHVFQLYR